MKHRNKRIGFNSDLLTHLRYLIQNGLKQGFPTFYLLCPPEAKISNVESPQEKVGSPQEDLKDF
jgi:hypothetical protein